MRRISLFLLLSVCCGLLPACGMLKGLARPERESERRIRIDRARLREHQPLKYHDSEKQLRRHEFEVEFYDRFHGRTETLGG